ncbi:MAG: hypothetical protein M1823_000183 [Watsoniomyces obsoletus]|nr:MAG: hypothetical protein M1823_000183 [Watsoniomyces obsoletus]
MDTSLVPVLPNRAVGFFVLGSSLHEILTRLKAQPHSYPSIQLAYSSSRPLTTPVVLSLPANGLRLRFDGPEQRLRLIEVLDFSKSRLAYKSNEIVKSQSSAASPSGPGTPPSSGPTFRHVYNRLFGPTFPGEYLSPTSEAADALGAYILSYPGISFTFPLQPWAWSPKKDFVSILSSSAAGPASAMAIFNGTSWSDAQQHLFSAPSPIPRSPLLTARADYAGPDEIDLVKIHGDGEIELVRRAGRSFWIRLGETTPQDLVTELGAPDAIYRKNDRRLSIHGARPTGLIGAQDRRRASHSEDDTADEMGHSSSQTVTDDSEDDGHPTVPGASTRRTSEFFYNYFRHGFDVFVSTAADQSQPVSDGNPMLKRRAARTSSSGHLTATKLLLHGNIPGSYPFNRHRRSRWTLEHAPTSGSAESIDSEMPFSEISDRLQQAWRGTYRSEDEERQFQKGMVLNRGWGDSPGSSCELLGGWEDSAGSQLKDTTKAGVAGSQTLGNTELFGFPGLVFEVLGNGAVSCLTVF